MQWGVIMGNNNVKTKNEMKGGDNMVKTYKIEDIMSGKVKVALSRGGNGTGLNAYIREKAYELLKEKGDAIPLGEFVRYIKGEREYREVYTRARMMFNTKTGTFGLVKHVVEGREVSFLIRKK